MSAISVLVIVGLFNGYRVGRDRGAAFLIVDGGFDAVLADLDVEARLVVVDQDGESVVHGARRNEQMFVEVGSDHQVDAGLVEDGHEMVVHPLVRHEVVGIAEVDHGRMEDADLDRRLAEGGRLHGFFRPGQLLAQVVLVSLTLIDFSCDCAGSLSPPPLFIKELRSQAVIIKANKGNKIIFFFINKISF